MRHDPDSGKWYIKLGNLLFDNRDFVAAEKVFRMAIHKAPSYIDGHYGLALCFGTRAEHKSAEFTFNHALELCPKRCTKTKAYLYSGLGRCLERQDKHEDAEASYREAISLDSSSSACRHLETLPSRIAAKEKAKKEEADSKDYWRAKYEADLKDRRARLKAEEDRNRNHFL